MSKRKTNKANQPSNYCDAEELPRPRRSIPVAEVNNMIEREVSRMKAARTIYNDREEILTHIDELEQKSAYHEDVIHQTQMHLRDRKKTLAQINIAITRELELDAQR